MKAALRLPGLRFATEQNFDRQMAVIGYSALATNLCRSRMSMRAPATA
jgi:hypothetical protein